MKKTNSRSRTALISILFVVSLSTLKAQTYYVDIRFDASGAECNDAADCFVAFAFQVQGQSPLHRNVDFGEMARIPVGGGHSGVPFAIEGRIDCAGEALHCNFVSENHNMPVINGSIQLDQGTYHGRMWYCQEYTMTSPTLTGGNCTSSVSLNIETDGGAHQWQATIDGTTFRNIPGATTMHPTVTRAALETLFAQDLLGKNISFRCRITDCYSRLSAATSAISFYAPSPGVAVTPYDPACYGDPDGEIAVTISPSVSEINDFTIEIYNTAVSPTVIGEADVINSTAYSITSANITSGPGMSAGTYSIVVINNTNTGILGTCTTRRDNIVIDDPPQVTAKVPALDITNVKCKGGSTGQFIVNASGGTVTPYQYFNSGTSGELGTSIGSNTATGLTAGSYYVTVRSGTCDSDQITVNVSEPANAMTVSAQPRDYRGFETRCHNTNDAEITATPFHHAGPVTYKWFRNNASISGTSNSITGKDPATYYVVATDANSCTATSTNVVVDAPPEIDFSITPVGTLTCPDDKSVKLNSSITSGTLFGDPTYEWSGPDVSSGESDDANLLNKGAGTYSLTVKDNQGCATTRHHTIDPPEVFTATLSVDTPVKCNGEANGVLAATLANGSGTAIDGDDYQWYRDGSEISDAAGPSFDAAGEGFYRVIVTYRGRCTTEDTYSLAEPDPVAGIVSVTSTAIHHGTHISCPGEDDGSLHVEPSGGNGGPFTYLWSSTEETQGISGKGAGTYSVTIHDHKGCLGTASGELEDPAPVTPDIDIISSYNGYPIKCHNSSDGHIRASATGGTNDYAYLWNTGASTADLVDVGAGSYTVTVTDENGCSNSTSIPLVPPAPITTSITIRSDYHGQPVSCHDASDAWLLATGGGGTNSYTHTWSTGLVDPDLSGIPAGTYTVTTTDANGCPAIAEITIDNPDPVIASIDSVAVYNGHGVRCHGDHNGYIATSAVGGTQQYTFSWTGTTSTTAIAEDLGVGSYTVTISDENGCADSQTHVITEPDALTLGVAADEHITCFGGSTGSITLSAAGGSGSHEYSIDGGSWQSGAEFLSLQARGYMLSVKDGNSCVTDVSHVLTQPDEIDIAFTTVPAFCADPRGEATATVTGGVGSYRYEWFDEDDRSLGTDSFIEKLYAGVYSLTVHDGNDCPMTRDIAIVASDGAQAQADVIPTLCSYSSDGSGELKITSGTGPFTFNWPDGQTNARGVNLAGGTYYVTIIDGNACKTIQAVTIPSPDALDVQPVEATDVSCNGNSDGSITVQALGGVGNYQYAWNNQTGAKATGLSAGNYPVVVTDGNGCVVEKTFAIYQPDPLEFKSVTRTLPLCNGDCNGSMEVTALGGNGDYQYSWTSGSQQSMATTLCAGDYTLTVTDSKNCVLKRTYNLGQPPALQLLLSEHTNPTCFGGCDGAVQVQTTGGTGSYDYVWSNTLTTAGIADLCEGDYGVTVTDDNNCLISQTYAIANPPALTVDLGSSVTLCVGQTHMLDAGAAWATYAWNSNTGFTASSQEVEIIDPGQYWLEVYNADGCVARDTFLLENALDLLEASFLIPKEAVVQDTVAIIDVSWPLPDQTEWSFPVAMRKVIDLGEVVFGQFEEPGIYEVGLTTYLAKCTDHISKTILILKDEDEAPDGGRLGHEEYVKEFELYPNPTEGNFEVKVEFVEDGPAMLSIWNTPMGHMVKRVQDDGKNTYHWYMDLRPLPAGTYVVRLDHAKGRKYVRFVVR